MNLESQLPLALDLCLKSSAILLAAFAIEGLARKTSAARRHLVWLAAFITLALLPLTLAIPPRWSWSLQRPAPAKSVFLNTIPVADENIADSATNATKATPARHLPEWPLITGGIWLVGALLLLARQAAGFWKLRGLRQRSSAITSGPAVEIAAEFGAVEMRESPLCAVPLTWGSRHPVILLPESASSWPETQLRAALAHEFGHIARRDFLLRQLAQIVRAIFWPNPLVWLAVRALHRTQEEACDDLALSRGAAPREYAMQLLEAARSLAAPMFTPSQAVAMALPSTLEGRVRAIMDEHRDRRAPGLRTHIAVVLAIAAVVAGSAFAQVKSAPAKEPAGTQVLIAAKFIEVPDDALDRANFPGNLAVKNADELLDALMTKKGVNILSAPRVLTRSGQRAMIEIGDAPSPPAPGLKFEATPRIPGNGSEIEIEFAATQITVDEEHRIDGVPVVKTRVLKSNVKLTSGQTCISLSHEREKGRFLLIAITASIVGSEGRQPPEPKPQEKPLPGRKLPGKPGFVTSPYAPDAGDIDVRGFPPGTEIKDPYTGKILLVPSDVPAAQLATENIRLPRFELQNVTIAEAMMKLVRENDPASSGARIMRGKDTPIEVKAAETHYNNGVLSADGHVYFWDGFTRITCDSLRYDEKKREVEATGSAKIDQDGTEIASEKIIYQPDTRKFQTRGDLKAQ